MKQAGTKPRYAVIDLWQGLKAVAWVVMGLILVLTACRAMGLLPGPEVSAIADIPGWFAAWVLFAVIVAALPRMPAMLRISGPAWRAKLILCLLPLGLFPLLAGRTLDTDSMIGALLIVTMFVSIFAFAAAESVKARRRRDASIIPAALSESDLAALERLHTVHPELIARLRGSFTQGEQTPRLWLTRPHPALHNRRPIDVLHQPDGERLVLQALEIDPD